MVVVVVVVAAVPPLRTRGPARGPPNITPGGRRVAAHYIRRMGGHAACVTVRAAGGRGLRVMHAAA